MNITPENARKLARVLVSKWLVVVCGMGIDDVPDTAQLCEIVDELEEILKTTPHRTMFKKEVSEYLRSVINADTIEELIL
jgi:ribosomal protein L5